MKKNYILTFSISILILFSVAIVTLMLMLPQKAQIVEGSASKYEGIKKTDFAFEQTKDISKDPLVKTYTINETDIANFRKLNQYKPGNSDPFAEPNTAGNTPGDGSNPDDNTTNGNGGTPNPPSSGK